MSEEDILYSTRKFAELAGVSIRTLKRWLKNGILIPAVKCDNGYNFYSQEQLENFKRVTPLDKNVTPLTESESQTCDTQVKNFEKPVTQETKRVTRSSEVVKRSDTGVTSSEEKDSVEYKTRKKVSLSDKEDCEMVTSYPSSLAVPTAIKYQHAMSFNEIGYAYLCPNYDTSNLKFQDGKIFFEGSEPLRMITEAELQNYKTKESITDITGLPILRAYYSILLARYEEAMKKGEKLPMTLALYAPDLAEYLGLGRNINDKTIQSIMSQFHSFDNVISIMKSTSRSGKERISYFPVLSFLGYDAETNLIYISSLYLWKVIDKIFKASIRVNRKSEPYLKKDGSPMLLPSHSYLIKPDITREKNQAAIENVVIIVTTIEQAGSNIPHIRASTIIERNPQLQERIAKTAENHRNRLLQRVFKKTWQLLRDQTNLLAVYKDIQLPDPEDSNNIPTLKTLSKVYEFPHNGKHGEEKANENSSNVKHRKSKK